MLRGKERSIHFILSFHFVVAEATGLSTASPETRGPPGHLTPSVLACSGACRQVSLSATPLHPFITFQVKQRFLQVQEQSLPSLHANLVVLIPSSS